MKRIVMILFLCQGVLLVQGQEMLTLEACRELAIQNNKDLQISETKIKMADQERKAAFTKYFPQISAMGTYMWNQEDINLYDFSRLGVLEQFVPQAIKDVLHLDIENVWVGSVNLVQPIFMGGKIVNYNQITKYAAELARSMNNLKLQELIYHTDEVYWQVVSLINKKKLADTYADLLRKMDKDVNIMIEEGVATKADGLSVKVKLNEAEMAQTKVNNGLALTRMLLMQICGLPLDKAFTLADEQVENISTDSEITLANMNEAFQNRMELKGLDLAKKIYKKKESIVLSEALPSVALTANYMVMNPNSQYGFKNEFAGAFHVGVLLRIPLSGWWENKHKRNAARAETHIKSLEMQDAREKIELQVNQSVYKVNEANKKLSANIRTMDHAEENLRIANLGFDEGVIPALNLMQAQTAWMAARSSLIDAQIEVKLSKVYLSKAMGQLSTNK